MNTDHHSTQNVLYQDDQGYVVHCACCNCFHIAYGTLSFDQTEDSFLSLMQMLEGYHDLYAKKVNPNCRCVQVPTPFNGFRLLLSTNDLKTFSNMLQEAYLIFQAERLVNQ